MNSVNLIGRLGRDPELRYTQAGHKVCGFSIAVDGRKDHTDWFEIQAWENLAENCSKYLAKGSMVGISGRIQTGEYQDKQGVKRKSFTIVAHDVRFLSKAEKKDEPAQSIPEDLDMIPF